MSAAALRPVGAELRRVPCPRCGKPLCATNGRVLAIDGRWIVPAGERAAYVVTEHRCRKCGGFATLRLALPPGVVASPEPRAAEPSLPRAPDDGGRS